jgi:hypothetical protein
MEVDDLKIVRWWKQAQKIVLENPDVPVVLNDNEFIDWVNYKVPKEDRISRTYVTQILAYNPETSTLPESTVEKFGAEFKAWWKGLRIEQELALYKAMLSKKEFSWQRYDNVLSIIERDEDQNHKVFELTLASQ